MAIHRDLPTSELHEPKGAATANSGEVYVANGSSSGEFKKLEASNVPITDSNNYLDAVNAEQAFAEIIQKSVGGWGFYKDSGATSQILTTTPQVLSINKLDSETYEAKLPLSIRGTGTLWNSASNAITPVQEDDCYDLRIDLPIISKTGSPSELTLLLDIGGGASPNNTIIQRREPIQNSPPYTLTVSVPIFCRSSFVANGGKLFISVDSGTATINGASIFIKKDFNGAF